MSHPNEKEVAAELGVSVREVKEAWHWARNDAAGTPYQVRPEKVTEIYETITTIQPDYSDDSDDSGDSGQGGGSSCYIATAAVQGLYPTDILRPLKDWRYGVLESGRLGLQLSGYYRKTAPNIAFKVSRSEGWARFIRRWFVLPATRVATWPESPIKDICLWMLFLCGLAVSKVVDLTV